MLVLVLLAPVVYAVPQLPHPFYGTLKTNGNDAPVRTVVEAKFNELEVGTYITIEDGNYGNIVIGDYLLVQDDTEALHEGTL